MKDQQASTMSTKDAPTPTGPYVQALTGAGLIFVSGQLPIKSDGTGLQQEDSLLDLDARGLATSHRRLNRAACDERKTRYHAALRHDHASLRLKSRATRRACTAWLEPSCKTARAFVREMSADQPLIASRLNFFKSS